MQPASPQSASGSATRRAHDRKRHPRLARELATVRAMVHLYCCEHHGARTGLCAGCDDLMAYATRRLDRCVFGDDKPTCANCKVHCYSADMRERVRIVMRFAGPRMLWRHPLLDVAHLVDGRREAPDLPRKAAPRTRDPIAGDDPGS
jgi:hypothetical protein